MLPRRRAAARTPLVLALPAALLLLALSVLVLLLAASATSASTRPPTHQQQQSQGQQQHPKKAGTAASPAAAATSSATKAKQSGSGGRGSGPSPQSASHHTDEPSQGSEEGEHAATKQKPPTVKIETVHGGKTVHTTVQQIEQLVASHLKGAGVHVEWESDIGTKEHSAPPSGIVLRHQRQLEKEKKERGKALKEQHEYTGTRSAQSALSGQGPKAELPFLRAKQAEYERGLELLNAVQSEDGSNPVTLKNALSLLYEAGLAGNDLALFTLGELYEFGDNHVARNLTASIYYYNASANLGNPAAQKSLAFFHDTGKGVAVNRPLALLYYDFAAQGGDIEAQITLGYKHFFGHGTRKDCGTAADYYGAVAQHIAEEVAATGLRYGTETHRLVNIDESSYTEEEDVVQYWKYSASSGDPSAQVTMGTLHLQGAYGVERNYELAREYFLRAAEQGDAAAVTNLGFLYAKGYGVEQNNETAIKYLVQAANQHHPHAQALLGYMYLHGMGVDRNVKQAVQYFMKSAEQGHSDGYLHLGNCYFYGEGVPQDYGKALQYYVAATEGGNLLAHFNLAQMHRFGVGVSRNCHIGVSLYKKLVERGPINDLMSAAYALYEADDVSGALHRYELAGEMGIEIAQSNAAWLYDHGFTGDDPIQARRKAFQYYSMAAEQKNPLAHLKMGDFYFYGLGTKVDENKAAAYYRAASDLRDAQATFNLGHMHQHGIGLPQDLHLAKRYYDLALEINQEAYLAWGLALASLGVHMAVDVLVHGGVSTPVLGLDSDMLMLVTLTVLLVLAIIARQYAVLMHQEREQRRRLQQIPPEAHPHQD